MSKSFSESQTIQAEIWISYLLRAGVLVSGTIIGLGWLLLVLSGKPSLLQALLTGKDLGFVPVPLTWMGLFSQVITLDENGLISLGIRILISLPILRVILTTFVFLLQKDYLYVLLCGMVLFTLSIGIFLGKAI
jgi:uncharacterized membrane protein